MKSAKNFQQPSEKLFPQVGVKSLKVQAPHSSRQTRLFCTFVFKLYFNTPFVLFCNSNVWLLRDSRTAILVQMAFKQLNIFLRMHFSAFSCILPKVLILTIFCSWMAKQLSSFHSAASQCNGVAACSATALIPFWSAPEKRWSTVWTSPAFYRLTNWKPVKEWFLKIIISIALERCSWCHSSIG